ncbi:hypothetical protein [Actinomadura parmotrematis]|uniref:Terpene synthase n=1 Tax=Actinomadura parmotrematis TaxID=2864039 RepID=A0ABS7FWK3_9ACTN|nr:hypothetical protein [Actinomadura parmotrematis]MBW8484799.1 hypothetical protein [Actinomadura parmotrematis]
MAGNAAGPGWPGALETRLATELRACMARYPRLFDAARFPDRPFMPIAGLAARALAEGAPDCTIAQLRVPARVSLWTLAADAEITAGTSLPAILAMVRRCVAVAEGAAPAPGDQLGRFLADVRADVLRAATLHGAALPGAAPGRPRRLAAAWAEELRFMLHAMVREWEWRQLRGVIAATSWESGAAAPPIAPPVSLAAYLRNAGNMGTAWVNLTLWIAGGDGAALRELVQLRRVDGWIQQLLRLATDAVSYQPHSADQVNALQLADRPAIDELAAALQARARHELEVLAERCPRSVTYLSWLLDYATGRHGSVPNYRGEQHTG